MLDACQIVYFLSQKLARKKIFHWITRNVGGSKDRSMSLFIYFFDVFNFQVENLSSRCICHFRINEDYEEMSILQLSNCKLKNERLPENEF